MNFKNIYIFISVLIFGYWTAMSWQISSIYDGDITAPYWIYLSFVVVLSIFYSFVLTGKIKKPSWKQVVRGH